MPLDPSTLPRHPALADALRLVDRFEADRQRGPAGPSRSAWSGMPRLRQLYRAYESVFATVAELFDAVKDLDAVRDEVGDTFATWGSRLKADFAQEQRAGPTLAGADRLAQLYLSFAVQVQAVAAAQPSLVPLPIEVLSASVLNTYVDASGLAYPSGLTRWPGADATEDDRRVRQQWLERQLWQVAGELVLAGPAAARELARRLARGSGGTGDGASLAGDPDEARSGDPEPELLTQSPSLAWLRPWSGRYTEADLTPLRRWAGKGTGREQALADARARYVSALRRSGFTKVPTGGNGPAVPSVRSLQAIVRHWERLEESSTRVSVEDQVLDEQLARGRAVKQPRINDLLLDLISEDLGIARPGGGGGVFRPQDLADALTEVQNSIDALTQIPTPPESAPQSRSQSRKVTKEFGKLARSVTRAPDELPSPQVTQRLTEVLRKVSELTRTEVPSPPESGKLSRNVSRALDHLENLGQILAQGQAQGQAEEVDASSDVEMEQAEVVQPQQSRQRDGEKTRHRMVRNHKRSRGESSDNETETRSVSRRKLAKLDSAGAAHRNGGQASAALSGQSPSPRQVKQVKLALQKHRIPTSDRSATVRQLGELMALAAARASRHQGTLPSLSKSVQVLAYDWEQLGVWPDVSTALGIDLDVDWSLPKGEVEITRETVDERDPRVKQVKNLMSDISDSKPPEKLPNMLGFLISAGRALGDKKSPLSVEARLAVTRRYAYHRVTNSATLSLVRDMWRAKIWPRVAAVLGPDVPLELAAVLGASDGMRPSKEQVDGFKDALWQHELPQLPMSGPQLAEFLGALQDVAALGPDATLKAVVANRTRRHGIKLRVHDWRRQGVWSDIRKAVGIPFDLNKVGTSLPKGEVTIIPEPLESDSDIVKKVEALFPTGEKPSEKLPKILGVLVSAGQAYESAPEDRVVRKNGLALTRRSEYYRVGRLAVVRQVQAFLRVKIWPRVAETLGVPDDLPALIGVDRSGVDPTGEGLGGQVEGTTGAPDAPEIPDEVVERVREVLAAAKPKLKPPQKAGVLEMILSRLWELSERRRDGETDLTINGVFAQRGGTDSTLIRHVRWWRRANVFDKIRDTAKIQDPLSDVAPIPPFPFSAEQYQLHRDEVASVEDLLKKNGYEPPDYLAGLLNGLVAINKARTTRGVWLTDDWAFEYHHVSRNAAARQVRKWRSGSVKHRPVWRLVLDKLAIPGDLEIGRGPESAVFDFALPDETHRATRPEVMAVAELLGKGWRRRPGLLGQMLTMAKAIARARDLGVPLGVRDVAYRYGIGSDTFVGWLHDQRNVWYKIADLVQIKPELGLGLNADKRVDWGQPDNRVSDRQWGEIQELVASMAPTTALDADVRAVLDVVAAAGNAGYWQRRAPSREEVERIANSARVEMDLLDSLGTKWRAVSEDEVTLWEHLLAIMDIPGDLPIGARGKASIAWPMADEMDPDERDRGRG